MKMNFTRVIVDNVYKVTVSTEDFSISEIDYMTKFGEPEVNFGGTFTWNGKSFYVQSITGYNLKINTGLPFTASFDVGDDANAKMHARHWENVITQRIIAAMNELNANIDDFTGTTSVTV